MKTNILMSLWSFENTYSKRRDRTTIKAKAKQMKDELALSLFTIYRSSGIRPRIFVYRPKEDKDRLSFLEVLLDKGLICEIKDIEYSRVLWGTKLKAIIDCLDRFNSFLYVDTDMYFCKKLPLRKLSKRPVLLSVANVGKSDNPKLQSSKVSRYKDLRKRIRNMFGVDFRHNINMNIAWFNRSKDGFDFDLFIKELEHCHKRVESSKHSNIRMMDDQVIVTIVLLRMEKNLLDFVDTPKLFSMRNSEYFIHNHNHIESCESLNISFDDVFAWAYS